MINYTIIIPHKNTPDYLERCLNSIPERNDIQVIVVDDNSNTNIIDFTKFPGLNKHNTEVYFTKEGKGAGYARNIGLAKAQGKWLLFADADDFFHIGFLDIIDKYLNSDNDIIYFSATSIDNESGEVSDRNKVLLRILSNYNSGKKDSQKDLIYNNWSPWCKMFNHKFIKENKLFFEEVKVGNDAMFVIGTGELAKKIDVDMRPIYCVTYNSKSLTFNVIDQSLFNERFLAKIRINNYLDSVNQKKYKIPVGPDIVFSFRYGIKFFFNTIVIAKNNNNKILWSIFKYLISSSYKKIS